MANIYYRRIFILYKDDTLEKPNSPLSFKHILTTDLEEMQDQIRVIREFDYSQVPALVSTPLTSEERKTIRTLPNEDSSGSSMYVLRSNSKSIKMSAKEEDYVWKDGIHHSRGVDIQLPVVSKDDSVIIVRKSTVDTPIVTWDPSSFLSEDELNAAQQQIFWNYQEVGAHLSFPELFNVYVGAADGIVPLGADKIIDASYFPEGIAPTGADLVADLEGVRLTEVGNVINTIPFAGYQVEWRDDLNKWIPSIAWGYTGIEDKVAGTIVRMRGWGWETSQHKLDHLDNVHAKRQHNNDGVEHFPRTGELIGWSTAGSEWTLAGSPINDPVAWTDPGDDWIPPYGDDPQSNDPNVEAASDRYNLHWRTDTGSWAFSTLLKDILDYTTYTWPNDYNKLGSLSDVYQYTETPYPGELLAWDKDNEYFRNYAYDTWNPNNHYKGSDTITDPDDPGYTGGFVLDDLDQWYGWPDGIDPDDGDNDNLYPGAGAGWMMYWDTSKYHNLQDPDDPPQGAWNVGLPFSWEPTVDLDNAEDDYVLKIVYNEETGKNEWRVEAYPLEEIGKVELGETAPKNLTYLVWSDVADAWVPRDLAGGTDTAAQVKWLQTDVAILKYWYAPFLRDNLEEKKWGVVRVPRDCVLTGFQMLQPRDGKTNFDPGGPGYTDLLGIPREMFNEDWYPGGVRLYKKTINWGTDYPADGGDDVPDTPADTITLISDEYDGSTERSGSNPGYDFFQWKMLDAYWRNYENPGGDGWLSLNISLVKDEQLLVEFVDSPYDPGPYDHMYQRAHCTWRIE